MCYSFEIGHNVIGKSPLSQLYLKVLFALKFYSFFTANFIHTLCLTVYKFLLWNFNIPGMI